MKQLLMQKILHQIAPAKKDQALCNAMKKLSEVRLHTRRWCPSRKVNLQLQQRFQVVTVRPKKLQPRIWYRTIAMVSAAAGGKFSRAKFSAGPSCQASWVSEDSPGINSSSK